MRQPAASPSGRITMPVLPLPVALFHVIQRLPQKAGFPTPRSGNSRSLRGAKSLRRDALRPITGTEIVMRPGTPHTPGSSMCTPPLRPILPEERSKYSRNERCKDEKGGRPSPCRRHFLGPNANLRTLDLAQPAVDVDLFPSDVGRILRGQKGYDAGNFFRLSKAFHRHLFNNALGEFIHRFLGKSGSLEDWS